MNNLLFYTDAFTSNITLMLLYNTSMVIFCYTDVKELIIKDKHLINSVLFVIASRLFIFGTQNHLYYIFSSGIVFLIFLLIGLLANKPMGGDIKLASYMGYVLGWHIIFGTVIISILIGLVFLIGTHKILAVKTKKNTDQRRELTDVYIPYSICLFCGSILMLLAIQHYCRI